MEIRIVIFLAFVSVTVVTNTMLIVFAFRLFARTTSTVTEAVAEFRKDSETRRWIESMRVAAEHAASITQATKARIAEFEPILSRAHEKYRKVLADADTRSEETAEKVGSMAEAFRDTVAKPAASVAAFVEGVRQVMEEEE